MRTLILLLLAASAAVAHDLELRVQAARPAVVVYATYGTTEPTTDADVSVFAPGAPSSPYQTGFTDLHGAFAFVPAEAGAWRVVIDDGYGHRAEQEIAVDWDKADEPSAGGGRSPLDKAILGVSVIFGITGLLLWRSRSGGGAS